MRWPQLVRDAEPLGRRVPRELADLVARCLVREPASRPAAVEVVAALEPLVAGLPAPRLR